MTTDTKVDSLVINQLTQDQYNAITNKSDTELYLTDDHTFGLPDYSAMITVPFSNSITTTGQTWTAPSDGIIYFNVLVASNINPTTFDTMINEKTLSRIGSTGGRSDWIAPSLVILSKGDVFKIKSEINYEAAGIICRFFPCKGAN